MICLAGLWGITSSGEDPGAPKQAADDALISLLSPLGAKLGSDVPFCLLGGIHVKYLYEKVEPIIIEARNHTNDGSVPFAEFEKLYLRLKNET